MKLSRDQRRAMRAYAQWFLGGREWADAFREIIEADDPIAFVNERLTYGETVDSILGSAQEVKD